MMLETDTEQPQIQPTRCPLCRCLVPYIIFVLNESYDLRSQYMEIGVQKAFLPVFMRKGNPKNLIRMEQTVAQIYHSKNIRT